VHPGPDAVLLAANRNRIVEVLRRLGVDRERDEVAEVGAALGVGGRQVERLQVGTLALLDEQALEDGLDRARRPQDAVDLRTATALERDG
jgi:hypothetical protein